MGLINDLFHTLICGFIFYGWGFSYYGSFERSEILLVIIGVWFFKLFFSNFWMTRFQFGLFEWLWGSLTYGKINRLK
jgi:uncharacterized protein